MCIRDRHQAAVDGQPVTLTYKEFELLRFLLENRGIVFDREQLLERVWGYGYDGGTRTVDVHVQTLRQKLGDCGEPVSYTHLTAPRRPAAAIR